METDPLLQPLALGRHGHLALRNRVYSTGHAPAGYLDRSGVPGERYVAYHEEKAKGGLGLTIVGGSSNVAIDSADVFGQIYAGSEEVLGFYERLSERVHAHGAAVMIQLTHMGRRSVWDSGDWMPAVSPSAARERQHRSFPKVLERTDIERLVTTYGVAVERAREGGLDGVEIMAAAGHLIDQFWSPRTNDRDDDFGGSLENRMRFGMLVLEEVRRRVGEDFVVGMRIPGDEGARDGLDSHTCLEIAQALDATGLLDFLSVVYGGGHTERELSGMMPVFGTPLGGRLSLAGDIRAKVSVPILHAGRLSDVATARHALAAGYVDLVGMTRAHIADPHLVNKVLAGEEERIRPCVGATYCVTRQETFCLHNPATGRELFMPQVVQRGPGGRRVVVVGGGPAGLEAARVSAARGHDVVLLEAGSKVGGQVQLMSRTDRHSEKLGIVSWLEAECRREGVEIRLNTYAEAADVLALGPEVVVVATGGYPDTEVLESGEDLVGSTWDVMGGRVEAGRRVLLYDDHGGEQALTAAERLLAGGALVELVTPDRWVGHDVQGVLGPDYLRALYRGGAVLTPDHELRGVRREAGRLVATLVNAYTDEAVERVVDQVVVEHGTRAVDEVYVELVEHSANLGVVDLDGLVEGSWELPETGPGEFSLFRIGDAIAHRNVHAAIYDARRLCQRF